MATVPLAPGYAVSRIIKGGWHLAGGHGRIDRAQALADMARYVAAGITTFDCADIYTGVEELIGAFRKSHPNEAARVQIHTKFVPDIADLGSLDRAQIERAIDRSLRRLGVQRLDLVQFHWWDLSVPRYIDTALELVRLRNAGKIAHLGVTNFDTASLAQLIEAGVPLISNQVQYSLLDERPARPMSAYCREHGVSLLCYGTVAGGFLSERWLGKPQPQDPLANRSLVKYRLIIEEFGGWELLQRLLSVLQSIAGKHGTEIATVATAAVLGRPQVAAAIVGATSAAHLQANSAAARLVLDHEDLAALAVVRSEAQGPLGDVYGLERDRNTAHGRIMKYDLNAKATDATPR
jgi:aryl-alcohol dehydrogenase-like predicted oxidoreductase